MESKLMQFMERVADWKAVAVYLLNDEYGNKTVEIERSNHYDVTRCRSAMIKEYLTSDDVSWKSVIEALRNAGYRNLAADIEKQVDVKVDRLSKKRVHKGDDNTHDETAKMIAMTEPTNINLTKLLGVVADWKRVALYLLNDVDGTKTLEIERSNYYDVSCCRAAMIREYLMSNDVSWQSVLEALRKAGYRNLAADIEKQVDIKVDRLPNKRVHRDDNNACASHDKTTKAVAMTNPTNINLTKLLARVADWKKVALYLLNDTEGTKVMEIEKANHYDVRSCRTAMITEYLSGNNVSWQGVLKALRNAAYKNLAEDIEKSLLN